jgi:hypothetical protein
MERLRSIFRRVQSLKTQGQKILISILKKIRKIFINMGPLIKKKVIFIFDLNYYIYLFINIGFIGLQVSYHTKVINSKLYLINEF